MIHTYSSGLGGAREDAGDTRTPSLSVENLCLHVTVNKKILSCYSKRRSIVLQRAGMAEPSLRVLFSLTPTVADVADTSQLYIPSQEPEYVEGGQY